MSFARVNFRHHCRAAARLASLLVLLLSGSRHLLGADHAAPPLEQRVAQLEQAAKATAAINSGDNAWMLTSAALVPMMTAPGLILFYGGLVPTKNVLAALTPRLFATTFINRAG